MLIGFDIEIAKPVEGNDWSAQRPLGISCAALAFEDGNTVQYWGGKARGEYWPQMDRVEVVELVNKLMYLHGGGDIIVTHNGLGFDFDILAEESGLLEECRLLARQHYDPAFQLLCQRGFMVKLEKAGQGMLGIGKSEGMDGATAPKAWRAGRYKEVLEYVTQDARLTVDLAVAIRERQQLRWISSKGTLAAETFPRLLTVEECLELPLPDTSWMRDPWKREKFTRWLHDPV